MDLAERLPRPIVNTNSTKVFHMFKRPPSLQVAQSYVNGPVAMVTLQDGSQMLMNEEGLLRNLPVNAIATQLVGETVVGHVLILHETARWTDQA